MNARRMAPWMALLQVLLLLPPTLLGSVCIPADGRGIAEVGGCECTLPPAATESALAESRTPECGPCRDEDFGTLRLARTPAPDAPIASVAFAPLVLSVHAVPTAFLLLPAHAARPPDRLPILRC